MKLLSRGGMMIKPHLRRRNLTVICGLHWSWVAGRLEITIALAKVMKSDLKSKKAWCSKLCFPHGHGQVEKRRIYSSLLGSRTGVLTESQM